MTRRQFSLLASAAVARAGNSEAAALIDVRRIWDAAPHNAFTDLARYRGRWYCSFREGARHASPDGRIRVISSLDAKQWESTALLRSGLGDLRDSKLSLTPDGRLMLLACAALTQPAAYRHQSLVWFSNDGREWTGPEQVGDPDFWLWRVTWHEGSAYGIGYNTNPDRNLRTARLYRSKDGVHYEQLVARIGVPRSVGESTIRFGDDGTAVALVRRDPYSGHPPITEADSTAFVGTARPPYTQWTWKDTGTRIGGPNFIRLHSGKWLAAVRLRGGNVRTALCWLDPERAAIEEFLTLPSKGDSSYAGVVEHDGLLWVSYYSSHEEKTAIYLARVKP